MNSFNTAVYNSPNGTTYAEILKIKDVQGATKSSTVTNTFHLRSTAHTKTFEPGFLDPGTFTMNCLWDKTVYGLLEADQRAGTANRYWRIVLPDTGKLEGQGWIKDLGDPTSPEDDEVSFPLTIQKTGVWVYTAAV